MYKTDLRKDYLSKRRNISSKEKLKLDDLMLIQFQRLAFCEAEILMSYWPIEKNNEPNTLLFSSYLRHILPGLQICYPVSDMKNNSIKAILVDENTSFSQNEYHIFQPDEGELIEASQINILFVPLIVIDQAGYRVGYGKGFYDRFLANCSKQAIKIGFSYFPPVEKINDVHQFDLPLDYCITPDSVYEF